MIKKSLIILILMLILGGCVRPQDKTILVSAAENPTDSGNHIFLDLATVEQYPSFGYQIPADYVIRNDEIEVTLAYARENLLVTPPKINKTKATGSARISIDLGKIEGIYTLKIIANKQTDKYSLKIDQEKISLRSLRSKFSTLVVPENLVGLTDYNKQFLNKLEITRQVNKN